MPKRRYTTSLSLDPQTGKQIFKIEKLSESDNNGTSNDNCKSDDICNDDIVLSGNKSVAKSTDSNQGSWWKWLGW